MKRKLVAALACRNQGSRLYGKPLQNIDVEGSVRIIDQIIANIRSISCIDEIVLGIAEGVENEVFIRIANEYGLKYIIGDGIDVLGRLISCGKIAGATDIFRVTTESPYLFFEPVIESWNEHLSDNADATFMDDVIDGCGFQILSMNALETSHRKGSDKHRSEFCSLYIRENLTDFKIIRKFPPDSLNRRDIRLTVDNPEDLVLCRVVYGIFKDKAPSISIKEIVQFLDKNPLLIKLCSKYTDVGYSTMYVWGK